MRRITQQQTMPKTHNHKQENVYKQTEKHIQNTTKISTYNNKKQL